MQWPTAPSSIVIGTGLLGGFLVTGSTPVAMIPPPALVPAVAVIGAAGAGLLLGAAIYYGIDWVMRNGRPAGQPQLANGQVWPTGRWDPTGQNAFRVYGKGWKLWGWPPAPFPADETLMHWYPTPPGVVARLMLPPVVTGWGGTPVYGDVAHAFWDSTAPGGQIGQRWGEANTQNWFADSTITLEVQPQNPNAFTQPYPAPPMIRPDSPIIRPIQPEPAEPVPEPEIEPGKVPPLRGPTTAPPGTKPKDPQPKPPQEPGVPWFPDFEPPEWPEIKPPDPPGEKDEIGIDSKPEPKPKPRPKPTPPWLEIPWPGGAVIGDPSQRPRPDGPGLSQELGRLEEKLRQIGGGGAGGGAASVEKLVEKILLALEPVDQAGEFALWSPCIPAEDPGGASDPLRAPFPASSSLAELVRHRLDAIASLIQSHKVLPQPTCRRVPVGGEWVSVNFESEEPPIDGGDKPLRKVLRYRDQTAAPLEQHAEHWRGFKWEAGPVCVIHKGAVWGVPQVWAGSAQEGKRVIAHAAAIAGVVLEGDGKEWIVTHSASSRVGKVGRMGTRVLRDGSLMVSKRQGPDGLAEYVR